VLGIGLAVRVAIRPQVRPSVPPLAAPTPVPAPPRPLSAALADAAFATLDLARETSAPAARVGRQVIATSLPGELPAAKNVLPASESFQSFGEEVNRGVKPFSGTAQRAFGFLIGPAWKEKPAPSGRREREA
jgi:hypothetical protein